MWFAIGVIGVLLEVILTTRAAARQQLVPADRPMRVAAFSLTPSVVVAMVLTVKFLIPVAAEGGRNPVHRARLDDALRHGSLHGGPVLDSAAARPRPDVIALGIVALLCFPQYGVVSAALSFGLLHIVFGLYILRKQRQTVV